MRCISPLALVTLVRPGGLLAPRPRGGAGRYMLALMLFGGLLTAPATAQQRPAAAAQRAVQIEVWEIRATKKDGKISDELRSIAEQLKKQFNYSGFRLEKRERGGAEPGETFTARLSSGVVAKITPSRAEGGKIRLKVEVTENGKPKLNTTYTVKAGAMQLAGGWKYGGSEDAMILGIRAR